jgi:hypothetical protein
MKIIGCDLHTRYQQIAMLDEETGELAGGAPLRAKVRGMAHLARAFRERWDPMQHAATALSLLIVPVKTSDRTAHKPQSNIARQGMLFAKGGRHEAKVADSHC